MKKLGLILCALLPFILFGCGGTLEVGIEQTPTPNRAATATWSALLAENARLATLVATRTAPAVTNLGRVAYLQGGDIWVKSLPDGKPLRLTTDGRNREPRWSLSGNWVAFRKDRQLVVQREAPCDPPRARQETCRESVALPQKQLWLAGDDGSSANALNQGFSVEAFAWSPTRDRLAFVTANGDLQTVNGDGTALLTLVPAITTDTNSARVGQIAWSPDGNWIAYEWRIQQQGNLQYQGLWKVSADGKERLELYNSGAPAKSEAILVAWTPQSRTILFWQDQTRPTAPIDGVWLYAVAADKGILENGGAFRFSVDVMLTDPDFVVPAPSNSASGARDVVATVVGAGQGTWSNKRVAIPALITPKTLAAISPAWSPDGTRLAFSGMPERGDLSLGDPTLQELVLRRIYVIDPSAQEDQIRPLLESMGYRDERPLWSADGRFILFARMDARGRASLWAIQVEGNNAPIQVVDELTPAPDPIGTYGHVDWNSLFDWWRETK